ncbi:MAG TPA: fumarylacetoacetate hydrolase family protein [Vicinamibacterales bacterium]|nr:fumarylacetoacetate hydrolase family protein [Vicinamibacterales bacterium]
MKRFYRIEHEGKPRYAVSEGDARPGDARLVDGDIFGEWTPGGPVALDGQRLLAPVAPSKIVAIGRNYRDHAAELNNPVPVEPLIFLKPPSAIVGPGEPIVLPPGAGRVDHEAELGVVIGARARHVRAEDASRYVFGLTCVNDVTARDIQKKDVQFTRGKGFDTFAPIGPCIVTGVDYHAPDGLLVEGLVNGERRQHGSTSALIFPIDYLIQFVSAVMTLLPGDIISTGTPAGVGPLAAGDTVTVRVAHVGELTNPVR